MEESIANVDIPLKPQRRSAPLFRQINGINVIDLTGSLDFSGLSPHRKLLIILLLFTVKDRGSALEFEPWHMEHHGADADFLRLFYVIDGETIELVPAPWHIWPPIIREFEALIGLNTLRHRLASWIHRLASWIAGQPRPRREGRFQLRADDETIEVKLVAWPSGRDERIFLTLDPISASLADRVRAEMKRLDLLIEGETRNYVATPPREKDGSQTMEAGETTPGRSTPADPDV